MVQLMEKQRNARQNALVKQLDQNCAESSCVVNGKHSFSTANRNNIHSKSYNDMLKRSDSVEHVSNAAIAYESKVSRTLHSRLRLSLYLVFFLNARKKMTK